MKHIFIFMILMYQKLFSPLLKNILGVASVCRYPVSCSEYAKRSILEYGFLQGGWMSILRLFSCQPFLLLNQELGIRN